MSARAVVERATPALVELRLLGDSACGTCAGACLWRRGGQPLQLGLASESPFASGDRVLISLPARHVLLGALLLHGVPWLGLLLGGLAGHLSSGTDVGCLLGAVLGAGLALAAAPGARRRFESAIAATLSLRRSECPS